MPSKERRRTRTDADTFSPRPHWPTPGEPLQFHTSVLQILKTLDFRQPLVRLQAQIEAKIDVKCDPPAGAAVGGFPTSSEPPQPCIAEQVARNRAQWDYISQNHLNTQAGRAAAYTKHLDVEMPVPSVAIKADWISLPDLLRWIPQLHDLTTIRQLYYTASVASKEYALVSMHVSSRQNAKWVWGTFEHQMNPGRCDYIGCLDSFGAQTPEISPNKTAVNSQYGPCLKTQQLKTLMANANLAPVWENYCLKSTQVDFTTADGTAYVLGNSVIEGIVGNGTVAASSCISCHAYASFGPNGAPLRLPRVCSHSIPQASRYRAFLPDQRPSPLCGVSRTNRQSPLYSAISVPIYFMTDRRIIGGSPVSQRLRTSCRPSLDSFSKEKWGETLGRALRPCEPSLRSA